MTRENQLVDSEMAESAAQINALREKAQPNQIAVGGKIPSVLLSRVKSDDSVEYFKTDEALKNRRVLLFSVPGAFTPTCSKIHLFGYLQQIEEFKKLKIDIICICPNNRFVAKGWSDAVKAKFPQTKYEVEYFPDWGSELLFKMGLGIDLSVGPKADTPVQLGFVAKRSAMLVDNGVVKNIQVEQNPSACEISGAPSMLEVAKKLFAS